MTQAPIATKLRESKLRHQFVLLDAGKGYIERADCTAWAERLARAAGHEPASRLAVALAASVPAIFDSLASRLNIERSGRISLDDWIGPAAQLLLDRDLYDRIIGPAALDIVTAYDVDDDAVLDLDQLHSFIVASGATDEAAEDALDYLDPDGCGEILIDDFLLALREFYMSAAPDAPGNWIYGRMPATTQGAIPRLPAQRARGSEEVTSPVAQRAGG